MKTPPPEATKTVYPILRQIVNLIPPNIFHAAASATANLGDGDIFVADRAYTDFDLMNALALRHIFVLLLRLLNFLAKWKLSFSRLAGVVRASVWVRRKVVQLLEMYGTAGRWKSGALSPTLMPEAAKKEWYSNSHQSACTIDTTANNPIEHIPPRPRFGLCVDMDQHYQTSTNEAQRSELTINDCLIEFLLQINLP